MGKHELNPEQKYRKQKKKQVYMFTVSFPIGIREQGKGKTKNS